MLFVFLLLNCRSPLYILDINSLSHICFTNTQFHQLPFHSTDCVLYCAFYFFLYFILFFNFIILYWFCHISTWIRHRYTCVPHPEPSSLLPPHTLPLGRPSAPALSIQYRAWNLDWRLVSYMILYVSMPFSSVSRSVACLLLLWLPVL